MKWDEEKKCYIGIPRCVALVEEAHYLRRVHKLGKGHIAKLFNERMATDATYRPFSSSKKQPVRWTETAVGRILTDSAVTGFIQYHKHPRGADQRIPIGEPVKVYPQIVTPEEFALANEHRATEQMRYQGKGLQVSNLLPTFSRSRRASPD